MIKYLAIIFSISLTNFAFNQNFYMSENKEIKPIYITMPTGWENTNYNEGAFLLGEQGFEKIEASSSGDLKIISGTIKFGSNTIFRRKLVFRDNLIEAYEDIVSSILQCAECFWKEVNLKSSPENQHSLHEPRKVDNDLKKKFGNYFLESINNEGASFESLGDLTVKDFEFDTKINQNESIIYRHLRILIDDGFFVFRTNRSVIVKKEVYHVGDTNLAEVNNYDLTAMIKVFIEDCRLHGIEVKDSKISAEFVELDESILGLSFGIDNDDIIKLKISPSQWAKSSEPTRWYLLYHELGHDVLNLRHGEGGKMMFNFADKGYSWNEFWEDKEYMLNSIND